ncbi:MAG: hypothetical protein FDZ69_06195 [Deltaproteobacteria bacterium]|nr:MAG: hypothetical protein FDZ69_06195 [Deltaproteobacteria bacterium]
MKIWRYLVVTVAFLLGGIVAGAGMASAEMLIYKGKLNATEYNDTAAGDQVERFAWNDSIYLLVDYDFSTKTVANAVVYQYWKAKTGNSWEVLSYGVHNLKSLVNNGKWWKTLSFYTDNLHNSADVRGSLAVEGHLLRNFDIGSATNPKVDIAMTARGKLIDMAPYFSEKSVVFGDLHLTLDLVGTREANRNSWDFALLRTTIEDRLSRLGTVQWTHVD